MAPKKEPLSYAAVSMTPRPPRVVTLIDGGEHWSYWARRALYRASRVWGGAGFAVVPHRDGRVHPVLLRACQAYDPDFAVTYSPTVEDVEHFSPGWFQIRGTKGEQLTEEERDRLFDMARTHDVPMDADSAAREQVAAVCSIYRTRRNAGWHEDVVSLYEDAGRNFANVLEMPSTWQGSVLACPASWGGALGAAVASHAGVAEQPSREATEPDLGVQARNELASWLLGSKGADLPDDLIWHPGAAVGINAAHAETAHDRTMTHLDTISSGFSFRRTGLLVLGDTAEDFALAHLWRLTFGAGYWLPPSLGVDEGKIPWQIGHGVARIARGLAQRSNTLAITSVSLSVDQLADTRDRLHAANPITSPDGERDAALVVVPSSELPWRQPVTVGLAVRDNWDTRVTVPTSVDDNGTMNMAAPLPSPALANLELAAHPDLNWQVDVQWLPGKAVRGRGLDSQELFVNHSDLMLTWTRSSRNGMAYQARRHDLVLAGTRPENKLARVALRDLSLAAWITAKCAEQDIHARPSDAGRRAAHLAKMLSGRDEYVELFGGIMLPALRAMLPTSATSRVAYPDDDGVALSRTEGIQTFAGIRARVRGLTDAELRERIDATSQAGVLRRGLALVCATCEQKQFQTVDKLGQRWQCARCDAMSELDQRAWKSPIDEPRWFYDLHPVGRHVLRDNGEVPALLSSYLRVQQNDKHGLFDDVEEVEFMSGGQPQVELDLVAYHDDVLTVAECKRSGSDLVGRSGRAEVRKKCQAAAWLRADRLLFATTAAEWAPACRSVIEGMVRGFEDWGPLGAPRVALVSGLGTEGATEQML